MSKNRDLIYDAIELPDYDEIKENKRSFAQSFYKQYCNTDPFSGKRLFEPCLLYTSPSPRDTR